MASRQRRRLEVTDKMALAGAAASVAAAAFWLWQRWKIPVRMREVEVHEVPPVEKALTRDDYRGKRKPQLPSTGAGDVFHRRYRVDLQNCAHTPESLMAQIQADPQRFTPPELAYFKKTVGEPGRMQVGDEYYIYIFGPWDGPVRVIEVEPDHFTLMTLDKHLEAGQIVFRTKPHPKRKDLIRFEIESWARSRDERVAFAYEDTKIAHTAQTGMWVWFCNQVAKESGGVMIDKIDVLTERAPYQGEFIPHEE